MKIEVDLEDAGSNWCASSEDDALKGVVAATGATRAEAVEEFRSALRFHLETLREDGIEMPVIDELELRELVRA